MHRLQTLSEDLQKQLNEHNTVRARLTTQNFELTKTVQEYETSFVSLSKTKHMLEVQLDDTKKSLDDESRVRTVAIETSLSHLKLLSFPSFSRRQGRLWRRTTTLFSTTTRICRLAMMRRAMPRVNCEPRCRNWTPTSRISSRDWNGSWWPRRRSWKRRGERSYDAAFVQL